MSEHAKSKFAKLSMASVFLVLLIASKPQSRATYYTFPKVNKHPLFKLINVLSIDSISGSV